MYIYILKAQSVLHSDYGMLAKRVHGLDTPRTAWFIVEADRETIEPDLSNAEADERAKREQERVYRNAH